MRVVRNPWNVMARLSKVVGGNGTSGNPVAPESSCSRCFYGLMERGLMGSDGKMGVDVKKSEGDLGIRKWGFLSVSRMFRGARDAVISACQECAPKVCREAFMTTEMSLGRPN
ncbi:hypothetical protein CRG98_011150 [Punica granatum]|uniref:Uncharacterized protein n=1 Tax=Punica granatum TaxID=22663 RepID=A0A2I0KJ05_PUNGR|nr:hypothetical protein CRG98_011150 [Punica granatum]